MRIHPDDWFPRPALAVPVATGAPAPGRSSASLQLSLAYVGLVLLWAGAAGEWITAAYLLSFWHYYLYWLAYYYGAAALDDFKRDAILLKSVSLAVLGCAYLVAPLDGLSLAVVTLGFLLNIAGAGRWVRIGPITDMNWPTCQSAGLPTFHFPGSRIRCSQATWRPLAARC